MPERCCARSYAGRSMSRSASGSWPNAGEILWRCSSCREACRQPTWRTRGYGQRPGSLRGRPHGGNGDRRLRRRRIHHLHPGARRARRGSGPRRSARAGGRRPESALRHDPRQRYRLGAGIRARSQALLSVDDEAEALYHEAVERLGWTRVRPQLARAHLMYGEWLRRRNRRPDARRELRQAFEMFADMGMEAFSARATRTGGPLGGRSECGPWKDCTILRTRKRRLLGSHATIDEPGDRVPALPECTHRGMAPAQGLHQARDYISQTAPGRSSLIRCPVLRRTAHTTMRDYAGMSAAGRGH
jgi:hypothetical protein